MSPDLKTQLAIRKALARVIDHFGGVMEYTSLAPYDVIDFTPRNDLTTKMVLKDLEDQIKEWRGLFS